MKIKKYWRIRYVHQHGGIIIQLVCAKNQKMAIKTVNRVSPYKVEDVLHIEQLSSDDVLDVANIETVPSYHSPAYYS